MSDDEETKCGMLYLGKGFFASAYFGAYKCKLEGRPFHAVVHYEWAKFDNVELITDYSFMKDYVPELRINKYYKKFINNVPPKLRRYLSVLRQFQIEASEERCFVLPRTMFKLAISKILRNKIYNNGLGLKIAKAQYNKMF